LKIGRIFGIQILIDRSWFFLFFLVVFGIGNRVIPADCPGLTSFQRFALAIPTTILLFLCVLAHELAHGLYIKKAGLKVEGITLFLLGGVIVAKVNPNNPTDDFKIAVAGPITSVLLATLCFVLGWFAGTCYGLIAVESVFVYLSMTNAAITIFNLFPGLPLDGGRVLRAIIWQVSGNEEIANKIASFVGMFLAGAMIMFGMILFVTANFVGLWFLFVGLFLYSAAHASSKSFKMQDQSSKIEA